ncbi:hemagglutinin repeat-containing protein, partial [Streptomyces sp. 067-1]|uniref:hemagglutinin repeat-containing protein n=1 Tax=Streptomyces sp. 067-1 TaxID=2789269 RepID=UPI0039F61EB2
ATASATASVSSSSASGTSSQTHNVNSVVDGGTRLTIASGDDTKLVGANVSGGDVIVRTGGDLLLQSLQDIGRQSNSSSGFGMGVGISSTGPGGSLTPSLSAGTGGGNSALVDTRTTLTAKGGMLDVEVGGTTSVIGATLAALDSTGKKDSGLLALKTGELVVADIADRASSANGAFSISGTLGLGGKDSGVAGEARAGITPGSLSGSYADSSYAATQAGTIGHGLITVASPGGTLLDQINRDITKATIVTRDDRTAFQVDIDPGATKELGALIRGDAGGSVILQGAQNLADDPTRTLRLAIGELYAPFDGLVDSGAIDKLFSNVTKMVAGNRGVEQHQFSALMNDRELQGKSAGEIADILKDRLIGVAAFGEKGDREKVRVELSDPTSQLSKSVALQGEMIAYAQARGIKDAAGLVAAYAADQQARDARVQASAAPPPGASPEQIAQL